MTTIVSPTTSDSSLLHGVYFDGANFIDRNKNTLTHKWVVFCYWSNQNSKYGCEIANTRTAHFCAQYGIKNEL